MLAYLFRDQGGSNAFAYSTDVTGRNIPQLSEKTRWAFVAAGVQEDSSVHEKVVRHLRDHRYCIFKKGRRLPGSTLEPAILTNLKGRRARPALDVF
jgi:hypothetical protein